MMESRRKQYTREFKLEAVKRSNESGRSSSSVAKELGIARKLLYRWREDIKLYGDERAFPGTGRFIGIDPTDELSILKKENAELRMERDILKKSLIFFAKHSPIDSDSSKDQGESSL